jgi:hypothetical protein
MRSRVLLASSLIVGAIAGAIVVLPIGQGSRWATTTVLVGAISGTAVAAIWHHAWITGPTLTGIVFATLCTAMGTGCDDYSGVAAILGFFVGFGAAHVVKWLAREMRNI